MSDIATIKQRIRDARIDADLSVQDVANALHVDRSTIYQWENHAVTVMPSLANFLAFASLTGASVSHVLGQSDPHSGKSTGAIDESVTLVPVFSMQELETSATIDDVFAAPLDRQMLPCPVPHSGEAFTVQVISDANLTKANKSWAIGDFVYLDPLAQLHNGSMVLARLSTGRMVFREYVEDGQAPFLRALAEGWPIITDDFRIEAVEVATTRIPQTPVS